MSASYVCAVHSGWVSLLLFQRKIVQAVDLERFAPQPDLEYTRLWHHFPKDGQLLGATGHQTSVYVRKTDHSSMLFKEIGAVMGTALPGTEQAPAETGESCGQKHDVKKPQPIRICTPLSVPSLEIQSSGLLTGASLGLRSLQSH